MTEVSNETGKRRDLLNTAGQLATSSAGLAFEDPPDNLESCGAALS